MHRPAPRRARLVGREDLEGAADAVGERLADDEAVGEQLAGDVEVGRLAGEEEELGLLGPGDGAQPADRPAGVLGDEERLPGHAVDRGGALDPGRQRRLVAHDGEAVAAAGGLAPEQPLDVVGPGLPHRDPDWCRAPGADDGPIRMVGGTSKP